MEGKPKEVCYFLSNFDPNRLSYANLIKVSRQVSFRNSFQMEKREVKYKNKKGWQYWNSVTPLAVEQFLSTLKSQSELRFSSHNERARCIAFKRKVNRQLVLIDCFRNRLVGLCRILAMAQALQTLRANSGDAFFPEKCRHRQSMWHRARLWVLFTEFNTRVIVTIRHLTEIATSQQPPSELT